MADVNPFAQLLSPREIELEQLSMCTLRQGQLDWLRSQGVSTTAIMRPHLISGASVRFTGKRFDFAPVGSGVRAITMLIEDSCGVIDICAWSPKTGQTTTHYGRGFALGQLEIFNPGNYALGGALKIHTNPLDWLRAGRKGICIVEPTRSWMYLRYAPRLAFADANYANEVRNWLAPPKIETQFLIEQTIGEAA